MCETWSSLSRSSLGNQDPLICSHAIIPIGPLPPVCTRPGFHLGVLRGRCKVCYSKSSKEQGLQLIVEGAGMPEVHRWKTGRRRCGPELWAKKGLYFQQINCNSMSEREERRRGTEGGGGPGRVICSS